MDRLTFTVEKLGPKERYRQRLSVCVNDQPMDALLQAFHIEQGWDKAGDYWGMNSGLHSVGQLANWDEDGHLAMAQCCDCGDNYCGSIHFRIYNDGQYVVWRDFIDFMFADKKSTQYRDYRLFGPFTFELEDYRKAIAQAASLTV